MTDFLAVTPTKHQRAFRVGGQTSDMKTGETAELLGELKELVENLRLHDRRRRRARWWRAFHAADSSGRLIFRRLAHAAHRNAASVGRKVRLAQ